MTERTITAPLNNTRTKKIDMSGGDEAKSWFRLAFSMAAD
jgi:hypothetical protein